jgi:hypothetical protein
MLESTVADLGVGLLESDAPCGLCVGNVQPTLSLYPPFISVPFTAAAAARAAAAHLPSSSPAVLEGNTEGALGHITGFAVPERTAATAARGFQVVLPVPCNTIEGPLFTTLLQRLCLVKICTMKGRKENRYLFPA